MAVDSKNKRISVIHPGLTFMRQLPNADSSMDQGDRQSVAGLYSGIAAAAAGGPTGSPWNYYAQQDHGAAMEE